MKIQREGEEIKHFTIHTGRKCECDAVNWEKESRKREEK
jgi:hypothetical protein